jgi:hypothetical protein
VSRRAGTREDAAQRLVGRCQFVQALGVVSGEFELFHRRAGLYPDPGRQGEDRADHDHDNENDHETDGKTHEPTRDIGFSEPWSREQHAALLNLIGAKEISLRISMVSATGVYSRINSRGKRFAVANREKSSNPFGRTNRIRLAAVVAVGVLAGGGAVLAAGIGQDSMSNPSGGARASGTESGNSASQKLVPFRDDSGRFQVSYPEGWERLRSSDPNVVLLVGKQNASFQVRVINLGKDIGSERLDSFKPVTDSIVASNKTAKLLADPTQIKVGSLPGYFYFYSFRDPQTGEDGAHSHFFLFSRNKMISLVFQSIPAGDFRTAAPTFDKITQSFRTLSN